ncbi:MAG TPA: amidohydrolase family protein [Humisphaera sp.]
MPAPLSRRSFLAAAAASAAAAALPAVAAEPATRPKAGPATAPAGTYIDVHTHLGQTWNTTEPLSAADLLKWMDAHGIARAVVLPLVNPEASSFPLPTEYVLEQTKPHRDRLIPFCCVDPRQTINGGKKGIDDLLKRYVDAGCKGFGEHKPGLPVDDPLSTRLHGAAGRAGLPVLMHIDNLRNTDAPGLPGLEKVLKEHPQTTFIGHGPGFWASISGDVKTPADLGAYPKGPVASGGALDRLLEAYPNLYCDLSAGSGAGAMSRDPKFAAEFLVRRQDRIMFGTDYLAPGQKVPQFEVLPALPLPEAVRAKVYRENAVRVLKL